MRVMAVNTRVVCVDLGDHLFQFQVGFGLAQFLHHPLQLHDVCNDTQTRQQLIIINQ